MPSHAQTKVRHARLRGHHGGAERANARKKKSLRKNEGVPSGSRAWHSHAGIGAKAEQDATSAAPETSASLVMGMEEGGAARKLYPLCEIHPPVKGPDLFFRSNRRKCIRVVKKNSNIGLDGNA